jgi:hypothetical protein
MPDERTRQLAAKTEIAIEAGFWALIHRSIAELGTPRASLECRARGRAIWDEIHRSAPRGI